MSHAMDYICCLGEGLAWLHGMVLLDAVHMMEKDFAKGLGVSHLFGGENNNN